MARATFSEEMRAQARELHAEGFGCNAIAAKLDISPSAISRWARDNDLKFDRSQTAMAVRAHTIDMAADRLLLAKMMHINAVDSLEMLDGPFEVFAFGGKENEFNSHVLETAPMEARRSAQMIAGVAFDKATKAVERSPEGLIGAVSLLDSLATGFARAAAEYETANPPTDG